MSSPLLTDDQTDTDISLMKLIKKGDAKAFELLLARHQRPVYNLAFRFLGDSDEAEDIAQEVFIRIYKAAATYSPDAKFTTWLYTIVRNLCFNKLRSRKQAFLISIDEEALPELPAPHEDHSDRLAKRELMEKVMAAVNRLPEHMKMALLLSKYQGLSYEEISQVMGCTVTAIKLRVHRAKAILARELSSLRDVTAQD